MSEAQLDITTEGGRTAFRPGATVRGEVQWLLESRADAIELRLFWYTSGKGTQDVQIVQTQRYESPGISQQRAFELVLPESPYGFSGRLISLRWALELVVLPGKQTHRLEIVVSPTEAAIDLQQASQATMTSPQS